MTMAAGTATGNAIWCASAAAGAVALAEHAWLGKAIGLAGAGYFLFIGFQLIAGGLGRATAPPASAPAAPGHAYRAGLTTALSNPQAILFFATVFLAFFPKLDLASALAAILLVTAITLGWYWLLTGLLVAGPARRAYLRLRPAIDILFGLLLIFAAIRLCLGLFVADQASIEIRPPVAEETEGGAVALDLVQIELGG